MTNQNDNLSLGGIITSIADSFRNWIMVGQKAGDFGHVGENTGDLGVANDAEIDGDLYTDGDVYRKVDTDTHYTDGSSTAHRGTYNNGAGQLYPWIVDTLNDLFKIGDATIAVSKGLSGMKNQGTNGHYDTDCFVEDLADGDAAGGILNVLNPLGVAALVRVDADITTASTAACTADFGVAASGVSSDVLMDGVDLNGIEFRGANKNAGTNGEVWYPIAAGEYITGSTKSGSAAGTAGKAYITIRRKA